MKTIFSFLIILFLLLSCKNETSNNTIKVDIDALNNVSIYELFNKIEIIKLKSNPNALLSYFNKVISFDEYYYILDFRLPVIYIFNNKGEYIKKIDNQGKGPNEYIHISDFEIDTISKKLTILDPSYGALLEYNLNGDFKKRISLPKLNRSYYKFKYINSDLISFWTFDYDNRVKFYSLSENKIIKQSFPEGDNVLNNFLLDFSYGNFLCRPISNTVYEFNSDCKIEKS